MCRRLLVAISFLLLVPVTIGCRQTTGSVTSPLSPAGAYSGASQLTPIQQTSGIGPFGGTTRVPPPPTGGYTVPNNYMGGAAPSGQASAVQHGASGLAIAGNGNAVQPSGWVPSGSILPSNNVTTNVTGVGSFGGSFNSESSAVAGRSNMGSPVQGHPARPQSGGMRVIDLTSAPTPPGYQGVPSLPQTFQLSPEYPGSGNGSMGYSDSINSGVAPANYLPGFGPGGGAPVANATPNAGSFGVNRTPERIAMAPSSNSFLSGTSQQEFAPTGVQTREFPMQPSPLAPTWNGVSNFDSKPPSTEPVPQNFSGSTGGNADGLTWRRPDSP